jgi:hypothetical protein
MTHIKLISSSLDREIVRFFALQDSVNIRSGTPILVDKIRTVRDQSANCSERTGPIDGRNT